MKSLKDIEKQNPFKVPDGYFEGLTGRIMSATSGIEPDKEQKSLIRSLKPYLAAAATVALLAVIGFTTVYLSSQGKARQAAMEITFNELSENYINDIDLLILEEKVIDSDPFSKVPDVNSNDIIDYLISQNIDILDIYEQL